MLSFRERFWKELSEKFPEAIRITPETSADPPSLGNTLALSFPGLRRDDIVVALDLLGISCSTGSACSSGRQEPSYVFSEMGLDKAIVEGAIRLSLDWSFTEEDLANSISGFEKALGNLFSVWRSSEESASEEGSVA